MLAAGLFGGGMFGMAPRDLVENGDITSFTTCLQKNALRLTPFENAIAVKAVALRHTFQDQPPKTITSIGQDKN